MAGLITKGLMQIPRGIKGAWNLMPKSVQKLAMASAIAGVGAGFAMNYALTPHGKEFREEDVAIAPIPPLLTPQDLIAQANQAAMMQEAGPAEGRMPGEWVARTRGAVPQQQEQAAVNPAQPRMSAIDPNAVKELGGANTPTV